MIALLLFFAIGSARAQDAAAISLAPASTAPVLASPLSIQVTAGGPGDFELRLDTGSQSLAPFDFLSLEKKSDKADAGRKTQVWTLTVVPLAVGTTEFPALDWSLGPGGRVLRSAPFPVAVVAPDSVKAHPDILELRRPAGFSSGGPWLLFLLAVAALLFAAWRWSRRKRPGGAAAPPAPPLPPEEEAEKALAALLEERLFERGEVRGFYDRLSAIVRRYLERRHGIETAYLTTYDIVRRLRKAAIDRAGAASAKDVLEACDLAKFAKFQPSREERDRDVARARRLFTPPVPAPEALSPKGGSAP